MDIMQHKKGIIFSVSILAIAYGVTSIFITNDSLQKYFIAGWVLLPPLWFCVEHRCLFDSETENFEKFKYGQELMRNVWAGFALLLAYLYFQ